MADSSWAKEYKKRRDDMKLGFVKIFTIALISLVLGACSKSDAVEVGSKASDFTLTDTNGNRVSLSGLSGKVIILDFFASWCPPCRMEVPDFIAIAKEHGSEDFAMVGIAVEDVNAAKSFAGKMGINYPVLIDDGKVSAVYGPIRSIPTTFVIGKSGNIAKIYIGYREKAVFESDIKELLQ